MVAFVKYDTQDLKLSSHLAAQSVKIKLEDGPETVATSYTTIPRSQHWQTQRKFSAGVQNTDRYSSNYAESAYSEDMSDGSKSTIIILSQHCLQCAENEARAMRILEIMNDFRTLQHHISSFITRPAASAPNQESYYLDGYVVLRQCSAESQAILASHYNPGNLGLQSGSVSESEVEKATLQRYVLAASSYLIARNEDGLSFL